MPSSGWPRIFAEQLAPLAEPLGVLMRPGPRGEPGAVARRAASELLDVTPGSARHWPAWLAAHQTLAAERLHAIIARYGGALLADAAGLGKSYVALALAGASAGPLLLVVPAVLVPQWRDLLARLGRRARLVTHEALSRGHAPRRGPTARQPAPFVVVDEAHRFRNAGTRRYQTLARLVVGSPVLLVTATPLHNRPADLLCLCRLFLRDDALTALGVPSLARAARGQGDRRAVRAVVARLVVARSRAAVGPGDGAKGPLLRFPTRAAGRTVRVATTSPATFASLVAGIETLSGDPAALVRLTLLRRLGSSMPALRDSLARHEALLRLTIEAARDGRVLTASAFARIFPRRTDPDLQLALFPLLLEPGGLPRSLGDVDAVARLRALAAPGPDPKAAALAALLAERPCKTIVFSDAVATVRHLLRHLGPDVRAAAVFGRAGSFGTGAAPRADVLRAFAPAAQRAAVPAAALRTDVLLATDLLSEGLNLQDAERVVHYDLPWSPARLAQRVGRIDRAGSPHARIESVAFLPAEPLAAALGVEARLARKARAQAMTGAAQVESPAGVDARAGTLDWCDRLHALLRGGGEVAPPGQWAAVAGPEPAVVLVLRLGAAVELLVVRATRVAADGAAGTALLARAATSAQGSVGAEAVLAAVLRAAPLVRARLAALAAARWRTAVRDRRGRRLVPWVLAAARRAARRGDAVQLAALDSLVAHLSGGMTAGEELLLDDLLTRREPLGMAHLLAWHHGTPPRPDTDVLAVPQLLAAVVFVSTSPPPHALGC